MARIIATANMPDVDTHRRQLATEVNHLNRNAALTESGSFTADLSGFSTSVQGTIDWVRIGNLVSLIAPAAISSVNSDSNSLTLSGLPTVITPGFVRSVSSIVIDNGFLHPGRAIIQQNSVIVFGIPAIDGGQARISNTNFTVAAALKGLPVGWSTTYLL